jgi:tRNAThr (cytosine32-N3)-methyltransferase
MARCLAAIDAAHAADARREDGRPAELVYAERVSTWTAMLVPDASDALRLAARAQHLERWAIPRADFPEGRSGYFRWRKAIQRRQGERALAILNDAGCDDVTAARVAALIAKATQPDDPEGQALEDAACLVFLETELEKFAHAHRDYTEDKLVDILRKTWARMTPRGRALASALPLAPEIERLMRS